ncbi:Glycoside hydrolase, family 5 [Kalmanozyma brasiliensis GHG001]|uniref:Glycoside hydrolase n=1 Tax=Kalmanozyma brasiliensis (strain GHG001) TaxID=1365824 RepID=V5GVE4_KALBG|nr:Glycoside hydrolase, family 5 [Kalmanozyma brasiliensis GHG001]EST09872.1 Glycoside hydrolase, family 5 [Kalmanozyma brasiliensis GHG001]
MPRPPTHSPVTGEPVPDYYIHASDAFFRDTKGRALLLRGVNLSGQNKSPIGQPSQKLQGFWESAESGGESFVGQPLNLQDGSADVHLARLRSWGFNCLRYVFTWEAIEHRGPGQYDTQYLDYTVAVLRKVKQYGFRVFMDPHQDLFSRFTGGSGAPYWTLIACGMNPRNVTATQAAFLQAEWPSADNPDPADFPDMLWATNYTRLAAASLSILFFAGRHFAPRCIIDGQNIQDWLQSHFLNACKQLLDKIVAAGDLVDECVIGWDSVNEPNQTYISLESISSIPKSWQLKKGPVPTPIQSFRLGAGQAQTVENWVFSSLGPKRSGSVEVDPKGKLAWLTEEEDEVQGGSKWGWKRDEAWPLGQCLWAAHGVWDQATGEVLNDAYFRCFEGPAGTRPAEFAEDYWLPHLREYASLIRSAHREAIMFIQPPVFEPPPKSLSQDDLKQRACLSGHFYDGLTLITKHWNWFNADAVGLLRGKYRGVPFAIRIGNKAIRQSIRDQLGYLRQDCLDGLGQYPTLIGEIGIPYDLDKKKSYYGDSKGRGIGDYSAQTLALDASLNGCDGKNLLSYTLWTYCPDNTHQWGEDWNGEDLSIWSQDDVKGADAGDSSERARAASVSSERSKTLSTVSSGTNSRSSINLPELVQGAGNYNAPSLLNGSRAAAAFCRPFPVATVGTPASIDFDIKSSEFSYAVDMTGAELDDAGLATDIYLPFLHYGADDIAAAASGDRGNRGKGTNRSRENSTASERWARKQEQKIRSADSLASSTSSLNTGESSNFDDDVSSSSGSTVNGNSTDPSGAASTRSAAQLAALEQLLSLDVEVSAGRWEVEGQYLKWYITKAEAIADDAGNPTNGVFRHSIKVKRKGGPVKLEMSGSAWDILCSCGLL